MAALDRTIMQASSWLSKSIPCHLRIRVLHSTSLWSLQGDIVTRHDRYHISIWVIDGSIGALGGSSEIRKEQGVLTGGL